MKRSLERIHKSPKCAIYRVKGSEYDDFVFSTPECRRLMNQVVYGVPFKRGLLTAATSYLNANPYFDHLREMPLGEMSRTNNVIILRGGLSFALDEALYDAFNIVGTHNTFFTFERQDNTHTGDFVWGERGYKKPTIRRKSELFIGDIVASGGSAFRGISEAVWDVAHTKFERLPPEIQEALGKERKLNGGQSRQVKKINWFILGSQKLEESFSIIDQFLKELFPTAYQGASFNYYEGIFDMYQKPEYDGNKIIPETDETRKNKAIRIDRGVDIVYPNTDLIHGRGRYEINEESALLSFEYLRSIYGEPGERVRPHEIFLNLTKKCCIDDGGARRNSSEDALDEKRDCLEARAKLAGEGITPQDLLNETLPDLPFDSTEKEFTRALGSIYERVSEEEFKELFKTHHKTIEEINRKYPLDKPESLEEMVTLKLGTLHKKNLRKQF